MKKIFFDLDGTLLDASVRMYALFKDLVPECKFSLDEYWELKRAGNSHEKLFLRFFANRDYEYFNDIWLKNIEQEKYLELDKLYPKSKEILKILSRNNELILLTARQSKVALMKELDKFDIKDLFSKILVTEHKYKKAQLLKNCEPTTSDIFISDMGKDIEQGKLCGVLTIACSYGFMNKENLLKYNPWKVIDNLEDVIDLTK